MRLATWQFYGRRQEREAGVAALAPGDDDSARSVLVVGRLGVGTTRLADEIARAARAAHPGTTVVRAAADDRIAEASLRSGARLVLTAQLGANLPDAVAEAVADGRLVVLSVSALSRTEMAEALVLALGGPVSARLVGTLWRMSHGVFAVLVALVDEAVQNGTIARADGDWDLVAEFDPTVLSTRLSARLGLLEAGERELLEFVVAGEPMRVEQAVAFAESIGAGDAARDGSAAGSAASSPPLLSRLIEQGYLAADKLDRVRAVPPAVGECIRALTPAERREEHHRRLLDAAVRGAEPVGEGTVRTVLWALRTGRSVPAPVALAAAQAANATHDNVAALAIASATADHTDVRGAQRVELLLQAATAARLLGRLDDAVLLLDRAERQLPVLRAGAPDAAEWASVRVALVAARADVVHSQRRDVRAALEVIDAGLASLGADSAAQSRELRGHRILHLAYAGRFVEARAEYPHARPLPSPLRQRVDAIHSLVLTALGRPAEAAENLLTTAREAKGLGAAPWVVEEIMGARFLALLRSGGVVAALAGTAAAGLDADRAPWVRVDDGVRQVAEVEVTLAGGDANAALRAAKDAVSTLKADGPADFLPRALSQLVEAYALAGDAAEAQRALVEYRMLPRVDNHLLHSDAELSLLAAELSAPRASTRAAHVLADGFLASGLAGAAARALHLAVRRGDVAAARDLAALESGLDGAVHALQCRHARGLVEDDGAGLLALSADMHALGLVRAAADAARQAEEVSLRKGHLDLGREAAHSRSMLLALLGETCEPARPSAPLTAREREIAALVAAGLSNRDIAATLVLSVRTVEGHLGRMYSKLGIPGRSAITASHAERAVTPSR